MQFVLLPPQPILLSRLLHLIGAVRPVGWNLKVTGDCGYDAATETLRPTRASVLTISVDLGHGSPSESSPSDPSPRVPVGEGDPAESERKPSTCSESDKRRRTTATGRSHTDDTGGNRHTVLPLEDVASNETMQPTAGPQDGPGVVVHWTGQEEPLPVVMHASELVPPVVFEVSAHIDDHQVNEPRVHDQEEQLAEPDLRRVLCCLISFQGRPRFCSTWSVANEDLLAFTQRVNISINPEPGRFYLQHLDPQPVAAMFTFLVVPVWWPLAGIIPFAVALLL